MLGVIIDSERLFNLCDASRVCNMMDETWQLSFGRNPIVKFFIRHERAD